MSTTTGKLRAFFALWPETALQAELAAASDKLHANLDGRRMRPDTLHLTLVFIGEVDSGLLPALLEAASGVRVQAFEIQFDLVKCWRHNRIACLAASRPPDALYELVKQLENRLDRAEVRFDRRPYIPHVTLLRQAGCTKENPAPEPLRWSARGFVLVTSSLRPEGAHYLELGRWPLL